MLKSITMNPADQPDSKQALHILQATNYIADMTDMTETDLQLVHSALLSADDYGRYTLDKLVRTVDLGREVGSTDEFLRASQAAEINPPISKLGDINIDKILTRSSAVELRLLINPSSLYKRKIIFFDTLDQELGVQYSGVHKWSLAYDSITAPHSVTIQSGLRNIVAMHIGPIRWYRSDVYNYFSDDYDKARMWRWTIAIEELLAQACIGPGGYRYHFMLQQMYFSNNSVVDPYTYTEMSFQDFNDGYYRFEHPITELKTVTMLFGRPFIRFPIAPNNIGGVVVQNTNPLQFTLSDELDPQHLTAINFTFRGFTTGDPAADAALIASVDAYDAPVTFITNSLISIPIDASGMTPYSGQINVNIVFIDAYRKIYPLTFVYFDDRDNDM